MDDPVELSFSSQFCCHRAHACQCLAHFGRGRGPSSKSAVPGSALLRRIDGLAGEQRLAPLREAALLGQVGEQPQRHGVHALAREVVTHPRSLGGKQKSTRLNSSHITISYAVFCLKKKNGIRYPMLISFSTNPPSVSTIRS